MKNNYLAQQLLCGFNESVKTLNVHLIDICKNIGMKYIRHEKYLLNCQLNTFC